jgi:hypothetical protein
MPPLDNGPMDLGKYLSVMGPFEIVVTLILLLALFRVCALCVDLVIRAMMKEDP